MKKRNVSISTSNKQHYIDKHYIDDDTIIGTKLKIPVNDLLPRTDYTHTVWKIIHSKPFTKNNNIQELNAHHRKEIKEVNKICIDIYDEHKKYNFYRIYERISYFVKYDVTDYAGRLKNILTIPNDNRTDTLEYLSLCYGDIEGQRRFNEKCNSRLGDKNPAFDHGGYYSPFSKKFVGYKNLSEEEIEQRVSDMAKEGQRKSKENGNLTTTKEYYIKRGMDESEAIKALAERQTTFSLEICIKKHGVSKGKQIWLDRQAKWHKNFKHVNFSQVSQELFWHITESLISIESIYFAELSPEKLLDKTGKNHELRLKLEKSLMPDFIDVDTKKIIEFDGTYWHGEIGHGNKKRERQRDLILFQYGYNVLHISESDYRKNKQKVIDECLNFLTQ